jgi:hypothetical protein
VQPLPGTRPHRTVLHAPGCPADAGSVTFVSILDLTELDLHGAAFDPEQ